MYVTRHLSHFKKFPDSLSSPPEGPSSGYLVLQDEESETYCCFGLCKNNYLEELPFPQNKNLTVRYDTGGENSHTYYDDVVLVPVLGLPLASNRYYAIQPHGKHIGEAFTSSREEDKQTCCFCRCVKDVKPRPLDPQNEHQQFQISPRETLCSGSGYFYGESVAPDAFPPSFLRRKGWNVRAKTPKHHELGEAPGLNTSLRGVLPDFSCPVSDRTSKPIVVGRWYCPFMFIREGTLRSQVKESVYYEMTLERYWEQIFSCQNDNNGGNSVLVDVDVEKEVAYIGGNRAAREENGANDGVVWFQGAGGGGEGSRVGLRVEIVQRMRWEQERAGFSTGEKGQVRVHQVEEFGESGGGRDGGSWRIFGCYVLVESFVLKRLDGTVVMTYKFRHTQQIKSKWE